MLKNNGYKYFRLLNTNRSTASLNNCNTKIVKTWIKIDSMLIYTFYRINSFISMQHLFMVWLVFAGMCIVTTADSESILATESNMKGHILKFNNTVILTLTCSSSMQIFDNMAEFLIDHKSNYVIKYHNGLCFDKNGVCLKKKCTCLKSGNSYSWTYKSSAIPEWQEFSCMINIRDGINGLQYSVYTTLIYNGTELVMNGTERLIINGPIKESTERMHTRETSGHHVKFVGIGVPVAIIIMISGICIYYRSHLKQTRRHFVAKKTKGINENQPLVHVVEDANMNMDALDTEVEGLFNERISKAIRESARAKLCLKVNYQDIVTTVKNDEIVNVLKHHINYLNQIQIEQIQSCLGKVKKNMKLLEIIWNDGIGGFNSFVSALEFMGSYQTLLDKIKGTKDDANINLDALDTEVEGLFNEQISQAERDYFELLLKDWQDNDRLFVDTKAAQHTANLLKTNNYVIVFGGLGVGKTAILRHIALKFLNEENYDIIPRVRSPVEIIKYLHPDRKQVFVVDDINNEPANSWSLQTNEILKRLKVNKGNTKLLISFERNVFNNVFTGKEIQFKSFCDLNTFELNEDEIRNVLAMYIGGEQISDVHELKQRGEFGVPFLCKLSKGRDIGTIKTVFNDPLKFIANDLTEMRLKNSLEFCVMTLITLSDNCFKKEWLNKNTTLPEDLQIAIEEVCDDFDLDFKNESTKAYIKERFEQPDTVYINRTGEQYHLFHQKVLEIMARLCSEHFINTFIQHASVSFISDRCLFASIPDSSERNIFRIDNNNEKVYFDRLFTDLKHGDMLSTFHNSQLTFEVYKNKFIKYCKKQESSFKEMLSKLQTLAAETKRDSEDVVDDYEHLKWKAQAKKCNQPIIASVWEGFPDIVQLLIDIKCDVRATDKLNRSALFFAALFGYSKIVNLLAQNGGDISMCDVAGRSPLYAACDTGHANVVKCLLHLEVDVSKCDKGGRSPLFIACATGHRDIVETLLTKSGCNVSKADDLEQSPLFVASMYGRADIVKILLEHHAKIEQCDIRGYTPLFAATINGTSQNVMVIKTLLDHNANICHCDNTGRTALLIACEKGFYKVVEILISQSEDIILICDKEQKSPLFIACENGHANIVKMLVKKTTNAGIDQCDAKGRSPLFIACFMGHDKVVDDLLANNANVDICDKDDRSPFYISSRGGYVEIMKKLFDKKADIHKFNRWGGSVLNVTCREGHLKAVEFLLKNEVDISKADNNGYTALYMASDQGHTRIVDMLLKKKDANVNVQTYDNMTPLHTACARGHIEIAQLLLKYKANKDIKNNYNATPKDLAKQKNNIGILNLFSD